MQNEETYLILSDVHGNLSALEAVLQDVKDRKIRGILQLGDLIDYGMRSNEIVDRIQSLPWNILVNLWGNHEQAIMEEDYQKFSSKRGMRSAKYTRQLLNPKSILYIREAMNHEGQQEVLLGNLRCLAIHGSEKDVFWTAVKPEQVNGDYEGYGIVLSGHSHHQHSFEKYYDDGEKKFRNQRKVVFINPGSVGQPRNQNPNAQYALLHASPFGVELCSVPYDIAYEQSLYNTEIDDFYRQRLERGI